MSDIDEMIAAYNTFRDEREWRQFHNFKDVALTLALEAAEVLEHAKWRNGEALEAYVRSNREAIGDELADVLAMIFSISHDYGIDVKQAFFAKLQKTAKKYPVEKAKVSAKKYTEL